MSIQKLTQVAKDLNVAGATGMRKQELIFQILKAGASGYLIKDSAMIDLVSAIRAISQGDSYLSPSISRKVIEEYIRRAELGEKGSTEDLLSAREREILQLIAEGNSTKAIARKLNLSIKTIETHRSELMRRLDIHDVAGLVRYAIKTGLVTLGP